MSVIFWNFYQRSIYCMSVLNDEAADSLEGGQNVPEIQTIHSIYQANLR